MNKHWSYLAIYFIVSSMFFLFSFLSACPLKPGIFFDDLALWKMTYDASGGGGHNRHIYKHFTWIGLLILIIIYDGNTMINPILLMKHWDPRPHK